MNLLEETCPWRSVKWKSRLSAVYSVWTTCEVFYRGYVVTVVWSRENYFSYMSNCTVYINHPHTGAWKGELSFDFYPGLVELKAEVDEVLDGFS